jgi:hypothetical protein
MTSSLLLFIMQVQREVPGLLSSIISLGKILHMLNYRKQLPVYVHHSHVNSTQDIKYVDELLDSGFQHDNVDISFLGTTSVSNHEQNLQVCMLDCLVMLCLMFNQWRVMGCILILVMLLLLLQHSYWM